MYSIPFRFAVLDLRNIRFDNFRYKCNRCILNCYMLVVCISAKQLVRSYELGYGRFKSKFADHAIDISTEHVCFQIILEVETNNFYTISSWFENIVPATVDEGS